MAKKKAANGSGAQSKSGLVREYIQAHPEAGNKDIEAALAGAGVKYTDITNARASLAKMNGAAGGKRKRGRKRNTSAAPAQAAAAGATTTTRASSRSSSAESLGRAALYAKECGSIDAGIAALQELKSLLA